MRKQRLLPGIISDGEALLLVAHHQIDAALARDDLLEPEPPGFADAIGKGGGNVERERHGVARQHRIGKADEVLGRTVEGERHEAPLLGQRHRAPADLVHAEKIIIPALQRTNGAIEKLRRDLVLAQRLERAAPPRSHALETQDCAGATAAQQRLAGEPGQFEPQPLQPSVVGCQYPTFAFAGGPFPQLLSLPFVDIYLQRSATGRNTYFSFLDRFCG